MFTSALLQWFDQYGRHELPWQKKITPYRVWVSEIMLQQTQVATVIPYYQKFMHRFPTVKQLALAEQDEVLLHWSGLGYYARARNLHRTAQIIHQKYRGTFPKSLALLMELPGIGRSTAGAILSLSMNIPATILDGNVKRVLTRYYAIDSWPGKTDIEKQLWQLADKHTPKQRCNAYNQAMMDLGALVCTRTQPQCPLCPLNKNCRAHVNGMEESYPIRKPIDSRIRPEKSTTMLLLQNPFGALMLEKRPPVGIWGGLWAFPECPTDTHVEQWCREHFQCEIIEQSQQAMIYHQFSHFRLKINPLLLQVTQQTKSVMESSDRIWYKRTDMLPGGIPAPVAKLLRHFTVT